MLRAFPYPLLFLSGWVFNFVVDVKFLAGFVSGWMTHSWFGGLFSRAPALTRRAFLRGQAASGSAFTQAGVRSIKDERGRTIALQLRAARNR